MEPVSLILAALLAGAAKSGGEVAGTAVKDAYAALRDALKRKLGKPTAEAAVAEYTSDPDSGRLVLEAHLKQSGADADPKILEAAAAVLRMADPDGARGGKYTVNLAGAQGVQVGDGNVQSNDFRSGPS